MSQLAILLPSHNRPHKLDPLLDNIASVTPVPYTVYCMVSDDASREILARRGVQVFDDRGDTRAITRYNHLCRMTTEPFVFTGMDDHWFHPDWFERALEAMSIKAAELPLTSQHPADLVLKGVVVPNDLHNPRGTATLISRSYIDEYSCCVDIPGVIYYPGYGHDYGDCELMETAYSRNMISWSRESVVEHMHANAGKSPPDATYQLVWDRHNEDTAIFNSRRHLWSA